MTRVVPLLGFLCEVWHQEMRTGVVVTTLTLWLVQTHVTRAVLWRRGNRLREFLNLAGLYNAYFCCITIVGMFKSSPSGFYGLVCAANAPLVGLCVAALNPLHICSRFPGLDGLTRTRFVVFAIFQGFAFAFLAMLHAVWAYMEVATVIFKTQSIIGKSQKPFQNADISHFIAYSATVPVNLLLYTGFVQLVARVCQAAQGQFMTPDELRAAKRSGWRSEKALARAQRRSEAAVAKLIHERYQVGR